MKLLIFHNIRVATSIRIYEFPATDAYREGFGFYGHPKAKRFWALYITTPSRSVKMCLIYNEYRYALKKIRKLGKVIS